MSLSMGNKNVVAGLSAILVHFSMSVFIERSTSMHQFHDKAAKGSANLPDHPVVEM